VTAVVHSWVRMVRSLWDDAEAAAFAQQGALGERVYTSRLLGRDHSLVLHGGGNTSVKLPQRNVFGEDEDILFVKGSGWDLETIEAPGFAPVRLERVLRMASLEALSDPQMVQELRAAMTDPSAPTPSVETILHAILPYRFVDHTHADALLAITNTTDGEKRVREIYGDSVVVLPYVMPGFDLARVAAERFPAAAGPNTVGMVLLNHGFFSFGATARESYERMIELVARAEAYLTANAPLADPHAQPFVAPSRTELAALRHKVSEAAGAPMVVRSNTDARSLAYAQRADLREVATQGPATPDHVIRTKRIAQIGLDVGEFTAEYGRYFTEHSQHSQQPLKMLDPGPRVVIDPSVGVLTIGRTAQDAAIAADVYEHTIDIVLRATSLGGYRALPAQDIFNVEYWDLEQAKLRRGGSPPMFAGEVVLVTGAASGIGKAAVEAFMRRGAAVVGLDLNPAICSMLNRPDFLGVQADVAREEDLEAALDRAAHAFGGVDMLVLNAGIFPSSKKIEALPLAEWRKVMAINLDANLALMSLAHPLLKCAPRGGRVLVIGSKNVPAPGPGASAYSASKAALNQLARVAALEWGADGIRVNVVHPNAVFDTGIWTEEVLSTRAASYGLSVDAYKKNNVLSVEVTSRDVAELVAEMCGPLFSRTTGAQVPIDGGNDRVI
jgi:rhamnose utilization protein RhaD (predicted bifunctional aldolase and dehydrogenase)/NAD(P)-dependent dehydrogenase (short-subunit alcohol dehydrogenase family)